VRVVQGCVVRRLPQGDCGGHEAMSRKHRRSRPALTKQLATKRDIQRAKADIISAIVHAAAAPVFEESRLTVPQSRMVFTRPQTEASS
jgi:hypothetical protein